MCRNLGKADRFFHWISLKTSSSVTDHFAAVMIYRWKSSCVKHCCCQLISLPLYVGLCKREFAQLLPANASCGAGHLQQPAHSACVICLDSSLAEHSHSPSVYLQNKLQPYLQNTFFTIIHFTSCSYWAAIYSTGIFIRMIALFGGYSVLWNLQVMVGFWFCLVFFEWRAFAHF